jgi:hypothetical protein
MVTQVRILVEDEYVGAMSIKENPREYWQKFVDAAKENPTLVQLDKEAGQIPVEGMLYVDNAFLPSTDGLSTLIPNNIGYDFERFALVVNGVYSASHDVSISVMPNVIAAYQSNPTFTVTTVENPSDEFRG